MTLLGLIITLVIVGVILWLINSYIPMQPPIKMILNVVVVIVILVWLLQLFGLVGSLNHPLPTAR